VSGRVFTAGEAMALLDPLGDGPLALGTEMTLRFAGAEANFAIALARLEVPVAWASRLGADPFGRLIRDALAGEGVDTTWVVEDREAPTGVFFKWREAGRSRVEYRRAGSAASRLEPADVPAAALDGAALVHLTGITTALGDGPRALVHDLAARAAAAGATLLFDPNLRPVLWPDAAAAAAAHVELLGIVDWYLCGAEEGAALWGEQDPRRLAAALQARGAGGVVVRVGAEGAWVAAPGAPAELVAPPRDEQVIDEIGAGDAFAAGFTYGLLGGRAPAECVRLAHTLAATALRGTGDWETLPRLAEFSPGPGGRPAGR